MPIGVSFEVSTFLRIRPLPNAITAYNKLNKALAFKFLFKVSDCNLQISQEVFCSTEADEFFSRLLVQMKW